MEALKEIKHYLSAEVPMFNTRFREALASPNALLQSAVEHFLQRDGKRIRPLLVLLSARLCAGNVTDSTLDAAVALELLHSASLIHDDVVDESLERRGSLSMNAVYNNKVSILIGDFFLSASLIKSVETNRPAVLHAISSLSRQLTEGEIEQLSIERGASVDENAYFSVIEKKTASLFSCCLKVGAISVDATEEQVEALGRFGRILGLCFQIQDDIFDYFPADKVGKPTGNDLREGKVTLPLLYALKNASAAEQQQMCSLLKNPSITSDDVACLVEFSKRGGGIEYARNKMEELSLEALAELELLPDVKARSLLSACLSFIIHRDY